MAYGDSSLARHDHKALCKWGCGQCHLATFGAIVLGSFSDWRTVGDAGFQWPRLINVQILCKVFSWRHFRTVSVSFMSHALPHAHPSQLPAWQCWCTSYSWMTWSTNHTANLLFYFILFTDIEILVGVAIFASAFFFLPWKKSIKSQCEVCWHLYQTNMFSGEKNVCAGQRYHTIMVNVKTITLKHFTRVK